MQSPEAVIEKFRSQGFKMTPQRRAVFEAIFGDESHPSAETIHQKVIKAMPSVSLRTVYQVLNDLADMGEVGTLSIGSGPIRFDPNTDDHQHFVCTECDTVFDVATESEAVLSHNGEFEVDEIRTVFRGRCSDCNSVEMVST